LGKVGDLLSVSPTTDSNGDSDKHRKSPATIADPDPGQGIEGVHGKKRRKTATKVGSGIKVETMVSHLSVFTNNFVSNSPRIILPNVIRYLVLIDVNVITI
jgi:hypothetical protein